MKRAATLVEILLVMAVVLILVAVAIGVLNPTALVRRSHDVQRKKDLDRIKIAFEEFYNDRGCFPSINEYLYKLNDPKNCETDVFEPWLMEWPCDPETRQPYVIFISTVMGSHDPSNCPHSFKILTKLSNPKDPQAFDQGKLGELFPWANYSVSSTNFVDDILNITVALSATRAPVR